jgi:hypothetical protein
MESTSTASGAAGATAAAAAGVLAWTSRIHQLVEEAAGVKAWMRAAGVAADARAWTNLDRGMAAAGQAAGLVRCRRRRRRPQVAVTHTAGRTHHAAAVAASRIVTTAALAL